MWFISYKWENKAGNLARSLCSLFNSLRVIREIKHDWDYINHNNITKDSVSALKKMHEKQIDKYIEDRKIPYTTKNIQNFIKEINEAVLQREWISNYLKNKLHLSYKNISSRHFIEILWELNLWSTCLW